VIDNAAQPSVSGQRAVLKLNIFRNRPQQVICTKTSSDYIEQLVNKL